MFGFAWHLDWAGISVDDALKHPFFKDLQGLGDPVHDQAPVVQVGIARLRQPLLEDLNCCSLYALACAFCWPFVDYYERHCAVFLRDHFWVFSYGPLLHPPTCLP